MTITITSRYLSDDGTLATRKYWIPATGGYVRDVTHHPGTLGPQTCEKLHDAGSTLLATPENFARVIRRELARRRREILAGEYR